MKDGVRARYTLEFKREAVRLVRGGEKLSAMAFEEIGFPASENRQNKEAVFMRVRSCKKS